MKFLFAGDPHGEFELVRGYGRNADVLILLGDQTPVRPLAEELGSDVAAHSWFILGNHDSDSAGYLAAHMGDMWQRNLHAQVMKFGSLRVASLGGVFRGRVWEPRMRDLRFWARAEMVERTPRQKRFCGSLQEVHWSTIFPEDFETLLEQGLADVLVTHEAPENHKHGFKAVGDLARALGVRAVIHGHHHRAYQAEIEGGIKVFGVGIQGFHVMSDFDVEALPRFKNWKSARRRLVKELAKTRKERSL